MLKIGGQAIPSRVLLLAASETGLILIGFLCATSLRCLRPDIRAIEYYNPRTIGALAVAAVVCSLMFYYRDACDPRVFGDSRLLLVRALQGLGTSCIVLASLYYLQPWLSPGFGITATAAPTILILLLSFRLLIQRGGRLQRYSTPVLVVGTAPAGGILAREIRSRPELDMQVIGFLHENSNDLAKPCVDKDILGPIGDLEETIRKTRITHLVVSVRERRDFLPLELLLRLKLGGIRVEDAYSCYERITGRILLQQLAPSALIFCDGFRKSRRFILAKRATDLLIAGMVLPLALPIMALIAVAIWLETGGPVLFRQQRVGHLQRPFTILKFRSMHFQTTEACEPGWTGDHDARITNVGRLIRRFRLDELPQLFNVVRGEMSLVGPRPEQPSLCALLEKHVSLFALRHSVPPGITGWAQVKYRYGCTLEDGRAKLEYDLFYIKHMSWLLDLAIIFETIKVMLLGRGAK
jgi:exopolysaccharide biosynthesis polyprenyl glycosylphosphotransferase